MYSKKDYYTSRYIKKYIKNNTSLMSGGFGLCGIPENSINYISKMNVNDLTVISNNIGNSGRGLVKLLKNDMISKAFVAM